MENKGKHFLDLLQLYITCVAFRKNDLITVKSACVSQKSNVKVFPETCFNE